MFIRLTLSSNSFKPKVRPTDLGMHGGYSEQCEKALRWFVELNGSEVFFLQALEFDSSNQPTAVLQKISASLQEKYQFIKRLSNDPLQTGTTSQEFHQASWLLSRAFQNLEDRMYREELLKILATFENGSPVLGELVEQDTLSASTIAATRLQNAWIQDELIKLSYREDMLRTVRHFFGQVHSLTL